MTSGPEERDGDSRTRSRRGAVVGCTSGLLATVAMDCVTVPVYLLLGRPATGFFTFIGLATARTFSHVGVALPGGAGLGLALHYGIGLALGTLFGLFVASGQRRTGRFVLLAAIVVTQLLSVALLVPAVLVLELPGRDSLQLFTLAFVFHLTYGAALGLLVRRLGRSGGTAAA